MISEVTGNYKSILAAKEVCNDIIVVFLGDNKSIMYTPVGQAFNISMTRQVSISQLFDQIAVVVTTPAPLAITNT